MKERNWKAYGDKDCVYMHMIEMFPISFCAKIKNWWYGL